MTNGLRPKGEARSMDKSFQTSVSSAINVSGPDATEGANIGNILRRLGTQIEDLKNVPQDDFDFESKENRLNVWGTDEE